MGLEKIETVTIDASSIDITKTIGFLRLIFGSLNVDVRPLAFSIAIVENLLYVEDCTIEDIKVMKDIYPIVAKQFGKSLETTSAHVERLACKCWKQMVAQNTVVFYVGQPIVQRPATRQLLYHLAVFSHTVCACFSPIDLQTEAAEKAEAVKIVGTLLANGMSTNDLVSKLRILQES